MSFIYVDSCIAIYLIEGKYSQRRQIKKRLSPPDAPPVKIGYSDLSRMECLIHPVREGNSLLCQLYESFFKGRKSCYIPITSAVFEIATELRAEYAVKTPDALHLASAKIGGCDIFLTNDNRLENVKAGLIVELILL